ncbi:hypothetical protein Z043_114415 [Scleropages formosus]|uniref:Uncharacterized protein n=1 Tax=Scleropages formosus TaxID=113540 RepID=A0A0P7V3C5_SCLFO|nr:hypothetical protein Z043_114415 [Scleropages formosus]
MSRKPVNLLNNTAILSLWSLRHHGDGGERGCVLPIAAWIKSETLVMAYKSINRTAPRYLQDLIICYTPTRVLRSSTSACLVVPRTKGPKA